MKTPAGFQLTVTCPVPPTRAEAEATRRVVQEAAVVVGHLLERMAVDDVRGLLLSIDRATSSAHTDTSAAAAEFARVVGDGHEYTAEERADLEAENQIRLFRWRKDLVAGSYSAPTIAEVLGVSRQTPHDWVKQGRVLAFRHRGQLWFPKWQVDVGSPQGVLPGLPKVLAALGHIDALEQAGWFVRANPYLEGRTPAEALKAGETGRVVDAARLVRAAAA